MKMPAAAFPAPEAGGSLRVDVAAARGGDDRRTGDLLAPFYHRLSLLQAGRADRMDGWRPDYRNSFAYQDGNYGYRGYYVDRREYNHYFREGFRRGYEDGYYRQSRYGRYDNGNYSLFEPQQMLDENRAHFRQILDGFLARYAFNPELFPRAPDEQVDA